MKVAVLGCGPAGLLVAHAATQMGAEVRVFSKKRKSQMYGAQYLHGPIPGITDKEPDGPVKVKLLGTPDGYRRRVYGDNWHGKVSPDDLLGDHDAWNLRIAYDKLWSLYVDNVYNGQLYPEVIDRIQEKHEITVSTVPGPILCTKSHDFLSQEIWAAGDAPEEGVFIPYPCPANTIICNGKDEESPVWYRVSNIFGQKTVEWPGEIPEPPVETVARVTKPLQTNCNCRPEIVRLGRYGAWRKGVLVHEVYAQAKEMLGVAGVMFGGTITSTG